jgi:aminoglycoside 6'-N-acetyltransferase
MCCPMKPAPHLESERLVLRRTTEADLPALHAILQQPGVSRWWGAHDEAGTREALLDDETTDTWTIVEGDAIVGAIQAHEEDTPDYRHAGIDLFIADPAQRRGLGPEAIRRLVRHLVDDRGHHRLVIDPSVRNVPAIHAYERVGFRRVGLMRRYERRDGRWGDGLLMELVVPDASPRVARLAEARFDASAELRLVVATAGDVSRILPMMRDFNRYEAIAIDEATLVPALEKLLGDPNIGGLWLIERQSAVIGYAVLTFGFDLEWAGRDAWLTELWVIAEARGGGTGRAALQAVENEAVRLGARALHLMVRHENVEARGLYESAGFHAPLRETLTKRLVRA